MAGTQDIFPIVGIGASAGGVEAIEGLMQGLPVDTGSAFVIVTHLSPERPSLLPEIVARRTAMPVHAVEDGAVLEPNHVYVLAIDGLLDIEGGRLRVRMQQSRARDRKPIDVFFGALARDRGEYAAGIVLSGGDGDGALGVKAIKERGGFTMAQLASDHGPQFPDMPKSALASGMVDLGASVEAMGAHIAEFARSFHVLEGMASADEKGDDEQPVRLARQEICAILRNQVGHDFAGYKQKTFLRRVQRRMQVNHLESLDGYVERLRQNPQEVAALFRDLLINVTSFFRDADAFEMLEREVIPKLFEGRGAEDTVRVWVPGCATGEEVFSIAILMREHMDSLVALPRVQIFATDIDEPALSVARAARYPETLLESVSAERRQRFFTGDSGSYVVSKDVRDLCVFSPHSVIRDPPFSRLDLVSCRNLLIYFGPDVQDQVIPTFHYALRPGGYLFLGTSENVTQFGDLFTPVDKKHRVFRARDDAAPQARLPLVLSRLRPGQPAGREAGRRGLAGMTLRNAVEARVLDRFAPAHVVVNADGDVVYYSARTGKYLEATPGAPNRQLLAMARKGLRLDLRTLLREAFESDRRVVRDDVVVESESDRVQRVNLLVEPLEDSDGDDRLFLVVFQDVGPQLTRQEAANLPGVREETALQLERELRDTRERLQSLIEEYETALEELKSSNEELVSVNEELQSTNEELEASKEELQSLNEELHTVNAELNGKVDQLDTANSDLTNLFESTRVATVFLDRELAIRNYTPAVSEIFNILPTDRGRPLTDLTGRVNVPTLAQDVRAVLADGEVLERTIDPEQGAPHYLMRIAPYQGPHGRIEGAVVTFIDVTTLRKAEAQQKVLIDELNHRVKNMLTVVIGVAEQTYRTNPDPEQFKIRFVERVHAMARSHELLSRQNWEDVRLSDIVALHLAPFGAERGLVRGPAVSLNPKQALALGMVVHELATNAGKYGALSVPDGRVEVTWTEAAPGLAVLWREYDGPPTVRPTRRGFGLTLVEREARASLGGKASIDFDPAGLRVSLTFDRG